MSSDDLEIFFKTLYLPFRVYASAMLFAGAVGFLLGALCFYGGFVFGQRVARHESEKSFRRGERQ